MDKYKFKVTAISYIDQSCLKPTFYSLQKGIAIINGTTAANFEALMKHISNSIGLTDLTTNADTLKFKETLELDENSWNLLIQSLVHIFKLSLKYIFKPTTLQKQLEDDLNLDSEKAKEFVKQWSACTKRDFGDLENRYKLSDITWQLNVQVASSVQNKETIPNARLQLNVVKYKSEEKSDVTLELNCEELVQLYNALETMQNKLDSIKN